MNRDGFWTGLILGGIFGIAIALLTTKAVEVEQQPAKGQAEEYDSDSQKTGAEKETGTEKKGESGDKTTSEQQVEQAEKTSDKEKEVRNAAEEVEKKGALEGESFQNTIKDKINFGKKIAQLEEALKNLREGNE